MLGWIGKWAASKGMVLMPNLLGLSRVDAANAISNAGLTIGNETSTETSNDQVNNVVNSQSITSGELVDYETVVDFNYQTFSFTPYSFTPYSFTPYSFTPTPTYSFTPYSFTPQPVTTYWATACCVVGETSTQVTGTSNSSTADATNNISCGGTLGAVFTGSYVTTYNIPSLDCTCSDIDNGYQWVTCNGSQVYIPTTINTCSGTVKYTCPTTIWYCSVTYYNTSLPQEQYTSYQDDTANVCSDSNTVCSTSGYPGYPSRPPACSTYSFTPYSFTPTYSFTPYSFTPTAYSFTPYSFTPYSFTPYSFTPIPAYSFTPLTVCIDEDTPIWTVGDEDAVVLKPAKLVAAGDYIWTMSWSELLDETQDPYAEQAYPAITNANMVKTQIINVEESSKAFTITFNDDISKRFTLEEKVLVKRDGINMFIEAKSIIAGDTIFEVVDNAMVEVPVVSTEVIDQVRNVYRFNASPVDTIIAGNMIVHNSKV